jgi:hypothetical protein
VKRRRPILLAAAILIAASCAATARSEVAQKGSLRVSFAGAFSPRALPRNASAAISVSLGGRISTTDGSLPPQLRTISIAINRQGQLDYRGLPTCDLRDIQPSTNAGALAACRPALVGEGDFSADVRLPQQTPFPSRGRILAFNGIDAGKHVLYAHVYGTEPVPTSYTLEFSIRRSAGTFGTVLAASMPQATVDWGFVTGIKLNLNRNFSFHGHRRGYVNARCPAPPGFGTVVFALARATFSFAGRSLQSTLNRVCKVRPEAQRSSGHLQ